MEKTFTLFDLHRYLQEISKMEKRIHGRRISPDEPSKLAINQLIGYSRALDVLKTSSAGIVFQLAN